MSAWKSRVITLSAIGAGFVAVSVGTAFASAPLSSVGIGNDSADATAAGIPGVLTVSESHAKDGDDTHAPSATWSALSVAGTSVIGRDSDNEWSGTASAAGALVDSVNALTCGDTPAGSVELQYCLGVLPGGAVRLADGGLALGEILELTSVLRMDGDVVGAFQLGLLPSLADTTDPCGAFAAAGLVDGTVVAPGVLRNINLGYTEKRSHCPA